MYLVLGKNITDINRSYFLCLTFKMLLLICTCQTFFNWNWIYVRLLQNFMFTWWMQFSNITLYGIVLVDKYMNYLICIKNNVYFELVYTPLWLCLLHVMYIYLKLHALDLIKTLDDMYKEKKFAKVRRGYHIEIFPQYVSNHVLKESYII